MAKARAARGGGSNGSSTAGPTSAPQTHNPNPLPVGVLKEQDRARMELRQVQRRLSKNEAPVDLVTLPGVQGFSMMTRFVDGGRDHVVEIIQMAAQNNEPVACKWWQVYRELPPYPRSIVSFDDVCAAAGVAPKDLIVVLVSTMIDFGRDVGNFVAAAVHPKVVAKLAESAQRIDGEFAEISHKDRIHFLQGQQFLPIPKSATINVNASANAQAAAAAASEPTVPSFSQTLSRVAAIRLPAGGATGGDELFTPEPEREPVPVAVHVPDSEIIEYPED